MKRIKYVFCTIFILLAVLSTAELYQNYLSVFLEDFYAVTFYLPSEIDCEEMLGEIIETSEKNDIEIFYADEVLKENNIQNYEIFVSSNHAKKQLEEQYNILSGIFGSIFGNQTQITYTDFENINKDNLDRNNSFYLLGKYDNMVAFKRCLVEKYAGSFPKQDGNQN